MKKAMICLLLALVIVCAAEPHVRSYIREAVLGAIESAEGTQEPDDAPPFMSSWAATSSRTCWG